MTGGNDVEAVAAVLIEHHLQGDTAQINDAAGQCTCGQLFYENGGTPAAYLDAHRRLLAAHATHVAAALAARAEDAAETVGQCRCDGSAYHSDEENAARHPFVRHPDCPVHAAQPPARRAEDVLAEGIRLALYEGGLWCGECDPADQDDDCCVVAPRIRAALLDADGGD